MQEILTIDGSQGEGGSQILRTALALSLCRGRAIRLIRIRAHVLIARLPHHIAERELAVLARSLDPPPEASWVEAVTASRGPGNAVVVEVESREITEIFTGFGERGVPAETVAAGVAGAVRRYLAAGVPVGAHLADQLLLPLALAGGGALRTLRPTRHTLTNMAVIERFLPLRFRREEIAADDWRIALAGN